MLALVYLHAQSKPDAVGDVQPVEGLTALYTALNVCVRVARYAGSNTAAAVGELLEAGKRRSESALLSSDGAWSCAGSVFNDRPRPRR